MSENQSKKKSNEMECLDRVIKIGIKQRGETKQIVQLLNNIELNRKEQENPDFVKVCRSRNKHEKDVLLGIEHFRVDHFSLKKNDGNVASTGVKIKKDVNQLFNKYHNEVEKNGINDNVISALGNNIVQFMNQFKMSTYSNFIESFNYSLNKHLKKVDRYLKNLKDISENRFDIKLGLLIDIHVQFNNLVLYDEKGLHNFEDSAMPMFMDIVKIFEEKIDNRKINYIIIYMSNELDIKPKVIAFKTSNIRKNLEKQKIKIYEYAGYDCCVKPFKSMYENVDYNFSFSSNGGNIDFYIEPNKDEVLNDDCYKSVLESFRRIIEFRHNKKNYITNKGMQNIFDEINAGDFKI